MKEKIKKYRKMIWTKKSKLALIDVFVNHINSLELSFNNIPEEFSYDNPVLILVDAVLSINRNYNSFVKPRIELIKKSGISTLKEFLEKIKNGEFNKIWNYDHPERMETLKKLTERFLWSKKYLNVKSDLEVLKSWARKSTVNDYQRFKVRGIGFTTYQYLRLLCGVDTTKPDIWLKRAVKEGTGKNLSEVNIVWLVEETAKRLKLEARRLDYALWNFYSSKNKSKFPRRCNTQSQMTTKTNTYIKKHQKFPRLTKGEMNFFKKKDNDFFKKYGLNQKMPLYKRIASALQTLAAAKLVGGWQGITIKNKNEAIKHHLKACKYDPCITCRHPRFRKEAGLIIYEPCEKLL